MANESVIVCRERYGSSLVKRDYSQHSGGGDGLLQLTDRSPRHSSITQFFRSVFLPQGYPHSVSKDYAEYQVWDTVQAFASSVSNSLATHSLLRGMGVGDSSATVLAASVTWLLKDGTGMTGRILFAWMKGNQLDCNAKRWRLFADFLNDFAICMEIMAPLTQTYFRVVVCVAGVCKSLVGVAGGATRAALTQHQARRNNMADVSAKDGSQETLVNLAALVCSLGLLPAVSGHFLLTSILFLLMTVLHLFANYKAVKAVRMESLNQARLHIIVDEYLRTGKVSGVDHVNALEPVLWTGQAGWSIQLGASFSSVQSNFGDLKDVYGSLSSKYLLHFDTKIRKVVVVLSPDANTTDQLQACIQAELVVFILSHSAERVSSELNKWISSRWTVEDERSVLKQSYTSARDMFPDFLLRLAEQGWRTDQCLLGTDEWRVTWGFQGLASKKDE